MKNSVRLSGFSLVELLIVLVIMAILAAIAVPAYSGHVRRAHRMQARVALMQAAQFMQRFHATHDRFDRTSGVSGSGDTVVLPEALQVVPSGGAPAYRLSIRAVDAVSYTLAASPVGVMADDMCGTLTLSHTGEQGALQRECWR